MLAICLFTNQKLPAISPQDSLAGLSVSHWGAQHGIPEETFSGLIAPGDGYVWLASNHGLVRFDGQRAQVFRLGDIFRPNGTGSCSTSSLSSLLLGADGNIWSGAASGCVFHIQRDRFGGFANFRLAGIEAPETARELNNVLAIRNMPGGERVELARRTTVSALRLDRPDSGLSKDGHPVSQPSDETVLISSPQGRRITLSSRDSYGRLWALLDDRQLYLAAGAPQPEWQRVADWAGNSGAIATRLLAGRNGDVWIASTEGLFQWKDGAVHVWGLTQGLPRRQVFSLYEDRAGCLWMGMQQAVARLCSGRVESIPVGVEQEEMLSTIDEDPQGNIWLGGRWGNLFSIKPSIFRSFTRRQGLPESHFTGVTVDRAGTVWGSLKEFGLVRISGGQVMANVRGAGIDETQALVPHPDGGVLTAGAMGIFRVDASGVRPIRMDLPPANPAVSSISWEDDNHLLVTNAAANYRLERRGSAAGGETWKVHPLQGPARIRQWAKDPRGRVWALVQFSGLHYLDGDTYRPAPNPEPGRARAWYSLAVDHEGLLWIGTTDGLEIYSSAEGKFLNKRPLLFGDQIFHISEDKFGKIWCATRQGLVRFVRKQALDVAASNDDAGAKQFFFERFGDAQSLPTTNFGLVTSASGATGHDGRIWFPGLLGLVAVQPADFERAPRPPAAFLRQLNADAKPVDLNQPLRIEPGTKTLEFLFQTTRLDPLGGEFCRLRLEGFDSQWRTCNEERTAQFTDLPPADYAFVVQTSSLAGSWNGQELRVPLTVDPAFHERIWVQALALISVLAGFGFFLWHRQKQLLERTRWLEEKVEERTAGLESAKHAAESANRAKSEFIATMSHEIRTPMNGVLGAVQILDESPLNQEQQKLVSVIRQSGEDLVAIVDDILNLAKVEAGKLTLEKSAVPVRALGEQLVALFRPKAEAKAVAIHFSVADAVPEFILSDPQRLRQILLNLLGNAVKFTDHGEVRLRVAADAHAGKIYFDIEDTGLGIPGDKIATLFDPFVQADSSTTRRFGGSGLGLSIVRRFLEAMGGSVEVSSFPGRGSTFRVTLPFEEADVPEEPSSPPGRLTPVLKTGLGMTVLLAEDNLVNQMIFQKMLLRLGCEVVLAKHGREALAALRDTKVDLVLMDCQMPELDGYQATRELRAWGGAYAQLPIIALTASAMAEDRQNCFDAGMNAFLSKPLMLTTLAATLAQWRPHTTPKESQP